MDKNYICYNTECRFCLWKKVQNTAQEYHLVLPKIQCCKTYLFFRFHLWLSWLLKARFGNRALSRSREIFVNRCGWNILDCFLATERSHVVDVAKLSSWDGYLKKEASLFGKKLFRVWNGKHIVAFQTLKLNAQQLPCFSNRLNWNSMGILFSWRGFEKHLSRVRGPILPSEFIHPKRRKKQCKVAHLPCHIGWWSAL